VKLPALKARGFPGRNKPQFIALLDPALKARGAARALPVRSAGQIRASMQPGGLRPGHELLEIRVRGRAIELFSVSPSLFSRQKGGLDYSMTGGRNQASPFS